MSRETNAMQTETAFPHEELASLVSSGGPPDPARRSALYEKYHLTVDRAAAEILLEHYHLKW
jgi:hypothetical protein